MLQINIILSVYMLYASYIIYDNVNIYNKLNIISFVYKSKAKKKRTERNVWINIKIKGMRRGHTCDYLK